MRLAVLSDIHSNHAALQACFQFIDTHAVDGLVFLGDYVTDCPYPQKTLRILREKSAQYPSWFIKGNREEYLESYRQNKWIGWKYSTHTGSLLYTYENLSAEDMLFFREMPICLDIKIDGCPTITACHGSPTSTRAPLFEHTEAAHQCLMQLPADYLLCGHTHTPGLFKMHGKTMINPGSVGISISQTQSQFTILECTQGLWHSEFISVTYDTEQIIQDFASSGLTEKGLLWTESIIRLIQTGINYPFNLIVLTEKLAREQDPAFDPYDIPEIYWIQAAKEIGII